MKTKRILILALAAALAGSIAVTSVTVSANSSTSYGTLQYQDVATLVGQYNLQVVNNRLTLQNLTDNDALDEVQGQLEETAQNLESLSSNLDAIIQGAALDPTDAAAQQLAMIALATQTSLNILASDLSSQAEQMTVDKADEKMTKFQLEQVDDQLANAAQNLFVVCKQLELNIQQATESRPLLERSLTIAQTNLSSGLATSTSVTEAQIALEELDLTISQLQTQLENLKYQLNNLLGRDYDAELTLGNIPEPDLTFYAQANVEKDVDKAETLSYSLRVKEIELSLMDEDSEYQSVKRQRRMKENEITMEKNTIRSSLANQYATIADVKQEYQLLQKQLDLAKTKYDQAAEKFAQGTISEVEKMQAEQEYLSAKASMENTKIDLFWQIETYRWITNASSAAVLLKEKAAIMHSCFFM